MNARNGLATGRDRLQRVVRMAMDPAYRRDERAHHHAFLQFASQYGPALQWDCTQGTPPTRPVLLVGIGFPDGVQTELGLLKGLQIAGLTPVVLTRRDRWLQRYYALAGVERPLCWDEFLAPSSRPALKDIMDSLQSVEDLLRLEYGGARIGRVTAATLLRRFWLGSLNVRDPQIRRRLGSAIASAMGHARAAHAIVRHVKPQLALFADRGYSPQGELFDVCLAEGIDVITWNVAHKSNTLMLKRYTAANRDEHHTSLSPESWRRLQAMEWTPAHRRRLQEELSRCYASGEWYSEVGTQFHTRTVEPSAVRSKLGLDPDKKTAVIFPHIFWDGTFFWGTDLFRSYEEWFLETVKAACANPAVNWIIKVHPGHLVKMARQRRHEVPLEVAAIQRHIGRLPGHVRLLPADTEISTLSLFGVMDYGLTVRGTVGLEAASFGIPVLTAGTGRYDGRGFTMDSRTREEHLTKVARIHDIPPLSPEQRELAERFAYGVFVMRPLPLSTMTMEYERDATASLKTRIHARTKDDWLRAPDLQAFAEWIADRHRIDFLRDDELADDLAHQHRG